MFALKNNPVLLYAIFFYPLNGFTILLNFSSSKENAWMNRHRWKHDPRMVTTWKYPPLTYVCLIYMPNFFLFLTQGSIGNKGSPPTYNRDWAQSCGKLWELLSRSPSDSIRFYSLCGKSFWIQPILQPLSKSILFNGCFSLKTRVKHQKTPTSPAKIYDHVIMGHCKCP